MLLAALSFLFIFLPPYVADVWALASDRPVVTVVREQLSGLQVPPFSVTWITTTIGLAALFTIIVLLLTGGRETAATTTEALAEVQRLKDRIQELERENLNLSSRQIRRTAGPNLYGRHTKMPNRG